MMADLSITASQVLKVSGGFVNLIAGEEITAGKAVYVKSADGRLWLADNDASLATSTLKGIALNHASAGQPLQAQTDGDITLGAAAAPTLGVTYVLSSTAGGIAPNLDLGSGDYNTTIGVGNATNGIDLSIHNSGNQIA
jgi:predicted transcriptional regulator